MPFDIATMGQQAAGDILSTGMGLMLENHNDKRQLEQQQKLGQMQYNFNNQMAEENQRRALEMWEKTNYSAQREQMEKAGLNPALLYGMSGGGSATTAGGNGQGVSGGNAPTGGHEIMDIGTKTNLALMQAQIANINADTKVKESTVPVNQANVPKIQAETVLTNTQAAIANIERQIKDETKEDVSAQITAAARTAEQELQIKTNEQTITTEEAVNARATAAAHLIALQLQNDATRKGLQVSDTQIKQMEAAIQQKWRELEIQNRAITIQAFRAEIDANYPGIFDVLGKSVNDIIGAITEKAGGGTPSQHRTEKLH